jgi:hypothetical protein
MRMLKRPSIGALAILATLLATTLGAPAVEMDMSKYPDWSGQWRKPDNLGNQWDLTRPPGRGQKPPLIPEYQALYEARQADRAAGGLGGNFTAQCLPHGVPQMMTGIYPWEIVVTPKTTYILSDYNEPRRIFTDGRGFPAAIEGTFNGYSIGHWIDENHDGRYNALEVETRAFKGPRNFDQQGIPLHADQQSVVKERFYLDKDDKELMHLDITTIDHALTEPWSVRKFFRREPNPIWMFVDCAEDNHHVWIGKSDYFVSDDGFLMPVRKNQKAPDLKFFNQPQK